MQSTTTTVKKTLKGTVVSDKMDKTAVVAVTRFVKHQKYKKYLVPYSTVGREKGNARHG